MNRFRRDVDQTFELIGLSNTSPNEANESRESHTLVSPFDQNDFGPTDDVEINDGYSDVTNLLSTSDSIREIGDLFQSDLFLIGVDKLALGMCPWGKKEEAIYEWDTKRLLNHHSPGFEFTKTFIAMSGHKVFVYLKENATDSSLYMKISFNPSENRRLVSIDDSVKIAESIIKETESLVFLPKGIGEVRIQTLHLTADFFPVNDLADVLRTIETAKPKKGWQHSTHRSSGKYGGVSVTHKTKTAGAIIAYDKSAQAGLSQPTLRIEAKVSKKARNKYGLIALSDLTEPRSRDAFVDLVSPFVNVLEARKPLGEDLSFRPQTIAEAVGAMWLSQNNFSLAFNKSSTDRHRKVYRSLGITHTDDLLGN